MYYDIEYVLIAKVLSISVEGSKKLLLDRLPNQDIGFSDYLKATIISGYLI